jgi:hypothetical protein
MGSGDERRIPTLTALGGKTRDKWGEVDMVVGIVGQPPGTPG